MKNMLGLMAACLVIIVIASFSWMHMRKAGAEIAAAGSEETRQAGDNNPAADPDGQAITLAGPLAEYMKRHGADSVHVLQSSETTYTPNTSEHVFGSVVGTSSPVYQGTFRVMGLVELPFDVPAHASTPKLHGTFQSFIQPGGKPTSDTQADVEFHLLNDQQYLDFLQGRPSEALFDADATHDQEVNTSLPPTMGHRVKYHILFLNETKTTKVVKADFQLDF